MWGSTLGAVHPLSDANPLASTTCRAHAEAAITQSEGRAIAHYAEERRDAVAFAHCAAAAIDGFSFSDVPLHPLLAVPLDAPALQVWG